MTYRYDPAYDLKRIQELVARDAYRVTRVAQEGAAALYLDEQDIVNCVAGLTAEDFYKTMPGRNYPGTWQDVYKPRYHGFAIYMKLRLVEDQLAVIISFKQDESA